MSTDQHILSQLRSGDQHALNSLFDEFFTPLMRKAYSLTGNRELSEEIVQDVFVSIWNGRGKLEIKTSWKSYLFQAVRYRCYTHFKKEISKPKVESTEDSFMYAHSDETDHPIQSEDLESIIAQAIAALPEKTRAIFLLSREEDLSYKEISEQLDTSVKNVEYHMGNALKILRSFLESHGYLWAVAFLDL